MNTIRLRTPFEVSDIPLSEYPRPQFARDSYKTLNGWWDYAIYKAKDGFPGWQGKILVPFSPESLLSGQKGIRIAVSNPLEEANPCSMPLSALSMEQLQVPFRESHSERLNCGRG